jgi:hypothetical protein
MKIALLGRARHSFLRSRWDNPLNTPQHPLVRPMLPVANGMYRYSAFHLTQDITSWAGASLATFDAQSIAEKERSSWFFKPHQSEVSTYAESWLNAAHEALHLELTQFVFEERHGAPAWDQRLSALEGIAWHRILRGKFAVFEAIPGLTALPAKGTAARFAVSLVDRCPPEYPAPPNG